MERLAGVGMHPSLNERVLGVFYPKSTKGSWTVVLGEILVPSCVSVGLYIRLGSFSFIFILLPRYLLGLFFIPRFGWAGVKGSV